MVLMKQSERRGIRILECEGSLTIGFAADEFELACQSLIGVAGRGMVLDFTRLSFLDSAGVGSVVACAKRAGERGTVVKIVLSPFGTARRIFKVTQLELAFELFDNVDAAVASFA
jgi:anti-sigma B factor antagonist